jgi:rRNA processing protein Gar1
MYQKGMARSLGTVLHLVDHKMIVRAGKLNVRQVINSPVVTERKKRVGTVYDIFGPVARPYVAVKIAAPLSDEEVQRLVQKKVYVL